jgi:hypothetical protein
LDLLSPTLHIVFFALCIVRILYIAYEQHAAVSN